MAHARAVVASASLRPRSRRASLPPTPACHAIAATLIARLQPRLLAARHCWQRTLRGVPPAAHPRQARPPPRRARVPGTPPLVYTRRLLLTRGRCWIGMHASDRCVSWGPGRYFLLYPAYVHAWGNSCARVCTCVFTNICTDARVRKQVLGHRTLLESHVVISGNVILADGVVVLLCLCLQLLLRLLLSSSDSMSGVLMHMHPLIL